MDRSLDTLETRANIYDDPRRPNKSPARARAASSSQPMRSSTPKSSATTPIAAPTSRGERKLLLGAMAIAVLSMAANVYFAVLPSTAPHGPGDNEVVTLRKERSQLRAELADMTQQASSAAKAQAKAEAEALAAKTGVQTQTEKGAALAAKLAAAEAALQAAETRAGKAEAAAESIQKEVAVLSSRFEASKQDHLTQLRAAKEATATAEAQRTTADSAATAAVAERDSLASQLAAIRKELATAKGAEEAAHKQAAAASAAAASGVVPRQWGTEMAGALETIVASGGATLLSLKSAAFPAALGGDAWRTPCASDDAALEHALRATGLPSSFQRPRLVAAALVALLLVNAVVCVVSLGLRVRRRLRTGPTATDDVSAAHAAVEAVRSQAEVEAAEKLATALEEARKDKERALKEAAERAEEDKAKALSRLMQSKEANGHKNVPNAHQEANAAATSTAAPKAKDHVTTPVSAKPPSKLFAPWSEPTAASPDVALSQGTRTGTGTLAPSPAAARRPSVLVDSLQKMTKPLMSQVSTITAAVDPRLAARPVDQPSPAPAPVHKKSWINHDFTGFFLINKESEAYQQEADS